MTLRDQIYHIKKECIAIHKEYGPGLLENTYKQILKLRLQQIGFDVKAEVACPLIINDTVIEDAYRIDLLVNDSIIIELKTVSELRPVHHKQLATYMTLAQKEVGILVNFYCEDLFEEGLRTWDIQSIKHITKGIFLK